MKFNEESIRERLPKDINLKGGGLDILPFLKEHSIIHNHYELAWEFIQTDFFKDIQNTLDLSVTRNWDEARVEVFTPLRDHQVEINTIIREKNQIEKPEVKEILKGLVKHLCAQKVDKPDVFRFESNCWQGIPQRLEAIKEALDVVNTIEKYEDDPETNGFEYRYWNRITAQTWACVQGGLYEEVFYIADTIRKLIYKIHKHNPKNCVFKNVLDQQTHGRFLMTYWMAEGLVHKKLGNKEKAIECYSNIGELYHSNKFPTKLSNNLDISWYTGQTRIIEALIQVYVLEPTKELKQRIIDYYIDSCKHTGFEPTETVRERGLITYMLAKYVLGIEIK